MTRIEKCHCGSGRPKDQCCGAADSPRQRTLTLVTWSLLAVAAVSITALGISLASSSEPAPATPTTPGPAASAVPVTPTAPTTGTPAPYEYNPTTNQHWDPNHGHWHSGPPPANAGAGASPISVTSNTGGQIETIGTRQPSERGASIVPPSNPAGNLNSKNQTPEPWEYDPADNTHFDPQHGHWHQGPPPEDKVREWKERTGGGGG
ncbi:MAG: hypothetical protein ACYTGG_07320 [Planctomycetota bacterium]|jgi:hypothetical protein